MVGQTEPTGGPTAAYLDQLRAALERDTQWVECEANDEKLWSTVVARIHETLLLEWRQGHLAGDRPERAFFVRCDRTTMSEEDLGQGRLVAIVGVAPLRPAEFVLLRIGQWT